MLNRGSFAISQIANLIADAWLELSLSTFDPNVSFAIICFSIFSYVKALDIWTASCLFFVFAAFLEFILVIVLNKVGISSFSWLVSFPTYQSGIVLDQVPVQLLVQVPSRHLSKWLKGTWSRLVTSQIFQKGTQLSASHMGAPLFFINWF